MRLVAVIQPGMTAVRRLPALRWLVRLSTRAVASVRRVPELSRTARLDVLVEGYVRMPHVAGTVSLVRDAGRVVIVDPGMVADRDLILRPLRELGVRPEDVTDVVVSHHHLDHTVNVALFPVVPVHDFQSVIEGDTFTRRAADGFELTPSIRLLATPGHTPQDVTTLVGTPDEVAALTHLWWTEEGPADDPYCLDREQLREQRERVLDLATLIVCAHGPAFRPSSSTPR
jgi:glyoxylase-like metal-dependent hydrolase (beta-lactamase superfamily II)